VSASAPLARGEWQFLQLTLFLCAWMLIAPQLEDRWLVQVLLQALLLNSALVTAWANPGSARLRRVILSLWLLSLVCSLIAMSPLPAPWSRVAQFADIGTFVLLLALLASGILVHVFRRERLTLDGVFATIATYLLLALLFSQVYMLVLTADPDAFRLPETAGSSRHLQIDMLYFSFVTLATVGYGDILPASDTARMLAMLEAVTGQFYVAVIVAVFVGMLTAQRRR
jgi:hypothetical protein